MKLRTNKAGLCSIVLSVFFASAVPGVAEAQTQYWMGRTTGGDPIARQWNTPSNWTTDRTQPVFAIGSPTATSDLVFGDLAFVPTAFSTDVWLWGGDEIGRSIEFRGTQSFTVGQSAADFFSLSGGNGISNTGSGDQVFNSVVNLNAPAAGVASISNSGTGSLTFNAEVNRSSNALAIDVDAAGEITFLNSVTAGGITVTGGDAMNRGGAVNFGGALNSTSLNVSNVDAVFGPVSTINVSGNITVGDSGSITGKMANFSGNTVIASDGSLIAGDAGSVLAFNNLEFGDGSTLVWALNSSAAIDIGNIQFTGDFLTLIDTDGLGLGDIEIGDSWVVFRDVSLASLIADAPANNFQLTSNVLGLTASNFTWVRDVGAGTLSLSVSAVPEPSTMVLLGVAGAIGGVVARRRAKRAKLPQDSGTVVVA